MTVLKKLRIPSLSRLSFYSFVVALFFFNTECFSAQIKITWSPNIEKNVVGYKVYYGDSSRNYNNSVDVGNRTSYTIANLVEGNTYFIGITAYDSNGKESDYSDELSSEASTPSNSSPLLPLEGTQKTLDTKRTTSGFVYAAKQSRVVHLPDCEKLISRINRETIQDETGKTAHLKIDALNDQIEQLEKEITKLRKKYFDEHPKIVQLKKHINRLKKLREEESVKSVPEDKREKSAGSESLPETENVIKFLSLEEALKDGGIACPVCIP